jgi:hypothetical protein
VDHLLLYWSFVLRSFGVDWVLPKKVVELLFGWWSLFGKEEASSDVWNLVPPCLMWTIWWERSFRSFEDIESLVGRIIEVFTGSLFDWFCACGFTSSPSLCEFLESLDFTHTVHSL